MSDAVTENDGPAPMGAVEQLARDDVERKKFLRMVGRGVGAAGAAGAFGAFLAACGSSSKSSSTGSGASTSASTGASTSATASGGGDLAIANYALTLEYLETEFYEKVVASGLFSGAQASLIKKFGHEEQQHVDALISLIKAKGGTPAAKPTGKFPIKSAAGVVKLAATVENLGANAYLGQAPNIKDKDVLAAALSIHTVEARHAATLQTLLKQPISPDGAFAKPADMKTVLAAVKPFIA
ncbi:MAG TPA: ferritin-like domain-containing protein [Solirubrobacteraceae bacterium]|nr:ferritin-like domain-containing protein [Solirubrobacteraceae bacterium]